MRNETAVSEPRGSCMIECFCRRRFRFQPNESTQSTHFPIQPERRDLPRIRQSSTSRRHPSSPWQQPNRWSLAWPSPKGTGAGARRSSPCGRRGVRRASEGRRCPFRPALCERRMQRCRTWSVEVLVAYNCTSTGSMMYDGPADRIGSAMLKCCIRIRVSLSLSINFSSLPPIHVRVRTNERTAEERTQ